METLKIRNARPRDLRPIVAIYNQAIASRRSTGHMDPFNTDQRRSWFEAFDFKSSALYVADTDGRVAGYGTLTPYRAGRRAMNRVAEVSFFVDFDLHGRGVGKALLAHMIRQAPTLQKDSLLAILLDINQPSVALLEKFGFERWGHLPGIIDFEGRRCGQYIYGRYVRETTAL